MDDLINGVIVTAPNFGIYTAQVYDALTGTSLHSYKGLQAAGSTLAVTGPDNVVVCASKDRPSIQAWPLHKHEAMDVRLSLPGRVTALALSPTSPTTLAAAIGEVVHVYSLESGCRLCLIRRHFQPVTCLAFYPCGGYFVSAGEDGFLYVWSMAAVLKTATDGVNAQNVQPYKQLGQHSDKVTSISISGGGEMGRLVSTSSDHTARVYDLYTLSLLHTIVADTELSRATISVMATRIVIASVAGHITIVDLSPYCNDKTIKLTSDSNTSCHEGAVNAVSLLSSGNTVVSAGEDGEVKVWAVQRRDDNDNRYRLALQRTIHRNKGPVTNMAVLMVDRTAFTSDHSSRSLGPQFVSLHGGTSLETSITVTAPPYAQRCNLPHDSKHFIADYSLKNCREDAAAFQFLLQS